MKMPKEPINPNLFAPCGMNCLVCYNHIRLRNPCGGCLQSDQGKPGHCRKCAIKSCAQAKEISYCYACEKYPCKPIQSLEKSYTTRYGTSLMENSRLVEEQGLSAFMRAQRERYTCGRCGGILSLHDAICSECGQALK